jgi:toxin ParE1/3/4
MAEYRLSLRAESDLLAIYAFTEAKFGQYQADAYHAGFERTFGLLADFPRIGTPSYDLVAGYRRFRFQSHYVSTPKKPSTFSFAHSFTSV